ncbi:hypothetical protein HMPREF3187_01583 [Aerococcus christensenii]|uniref:Uncharacterized protein n=1 Tax=Aerococcus christensenii TaxID=87541 RepID=A0A133XSQ4_9LACT|nr:hypothetical protein HMPREF3187_01583 [Aerococcus christensenii]
MRVKSPLHCVIHPFSSQASDLSQIHLLFISLLPSICYVSLYRAIINKKRKLVLLWIKLK